MSKILFEGGAKSIIILKKGLPLLRKDNYINEINKINNIKDLKLSSVHILGGIGMGESKSSITNSFGKLKTTEKLYVNELITYKQQFIKKSTRYYYVNCSQILEIFLRLIIKNV